jgi:hypothetical protein
LHSYATFLTAHLSYLKRFKHKTLKIIFALK